MGAVTPKMREQEEHKAWNSGNLDLNQAETDKTLTYGRVFSASHNLPLSNPPVLMP